MSGKRIIQCRQMKHLASSRLLESIVRVLNHVVMREMCVVGLPGVQSDSESESRALEDTATLVNARKQPMWKTKEQVAGIGLFLLFMKENVLKKCTF